MKICLIGPSYPFRGGIAHYTTLLYRSLKQKHTVKFYSFKRQYPLWLFPGRSDLDPSAFVIKENNVERVLDSLNPWTWWLMFIKVKRYNPDLLILPWWASFWTLQFLTIAKLVKKFTKSKLLFICHNIIQHEASALDKLCTKLVLRNGDYFIVHSIEELNCLRKLVPDANVKKTFHPIYEVFNYSPLEKEEAKKSLGLIGKTILFFGFVRPYKGLKYLIEAMPTILQSLDVTLMVVGEFWENKKKYLNYIEAFHLQDKVRIIDQYIPNEEVRLYFYAADLVILPYVSVTGSGVVQIAFGFNKPVVVTAVGDLSNIVKNGQTGFVVPPKDPLSLARAIISFYKGNWGDKFIKNIITQKSKFKWDKVVECIESFFLKG